MIPKVGFQGKVYNEARQKYVPIKRVKLDRFVKSGKNPFLAKAGDILKPNDEKFQAIYLAAENYEPGDRNLPVYDIVHSRFLRIGKDSLSNLHNVYGQRIEVNA